MFAPVANCIRYCLTQILDGMNNVIPDDMQEFMDINALYDDTVDLIVGSTIEKGKWSVWARYVTGICCCCDKDNILYGN